MKVSNATSSGGKGPLMVQTLDLAPAAGMSPTGQIFPPATTSRFRPTTHAEPAVWKVGRGFTSSAGRTGCYSPP